MHLPTHSPGDTDQLITALTRELSKYHQLLLYAQGLPGLLRQLELGCAAVDKSEKYYSTCQFLSHIDVSVSALEFRSIDRTLAVVCQNQTLAMPNERMGVYVYPASIFPAMLNILDCMDIPYSYV